MNRIDSAGWTALHHAASNGHLTSVQVLVRKGKANLKAMNSEGKIALEVAQDERVIHYLKSAQK